MSNRTLEFFSMNDDKTAEITIKEGPSLYTFKAELIRVEQERNLEKGDVVQLSPSSAWPGGFMVVEDVAAWGAKGYISIPKSRGQAAGRAYYRAKWDEMVRIGEATWLIGD